MCNDILEFKCGLLLIGTCIFHSGLIAQLVCELGLWVCVKRFFGFDVVLV